MEISEQNFWPAILSFLEFQSLGYQIINRSGKAFLMIFFSLKFYLSSHPYDLMPYIFDFSYSVYISQKDHRFEVNPPKYWCHRVKILHVCHVRFRVQALEL